MSELEFKPLDVALFQINKVIETGYAQKIYAGEAKALNLEISRLKEELAARIQLSNSWAEAATKAHERIAELEKELKVER